MVHNNAMVPCVLRPVGIKPGNEWMIDEMQQEVDRNWEELLKLCDM